MAKGISLNRKDKRGTLGNQEERMNIVRKYIAKYNWFFIASWSKFNCLTVKAKIVTLWCHSKFM